MPDRIRTADLEADRVLLTDLLSHNLSPVAGGRRFDWLYTENPHGPARVWIAVEPGTGKGTGASAAFPRRLYVDGVLRLGYVLGDFCIDPEYRSLGLALQLQRACLEQLVSTSAVLSYDFPSDRMMAIYRRMKIAPMGQIVRWSKALRADRQIGKVAKRPQLVRILSAPVNKLLEWKDIAFRSSQGWTIGEHRADCQEEFTLLARNVGSRYGTCVERSAEYLNWRYLRHPLVRYELLTARRGTELMSYVVFSQTEEDAKIVDLFGFGDTTMWNALMAHVLLRLRARAVLTVSTPVLATDPWAGLLRKWGFRPREKSPVVVCELGRTAATSQDLPSPWFLMDGDRES
jgi:GNAT superfamily N-acetyltransferase